jgi:hypothetical protein
LQIPEREPSVRAGIGAAKLSAQRIGCDSLQPHLSSHDKRVCPLAHHNAFNGHFRHLRKLCFSSDQKQEARTDTNQPPEEMHFEMFSFVTTGASIKQQIPSEFSARP